MEDRKTFACLTLGCKVNQYETNAVSQIFLENNYIEKSFDEIADVYVVNTCTVTNMADRKSRQMLRKLKEKNKNAILVAIGCYAQVGKEQLEQMEEIDIVLGNNEKRDIVNFIKQYELEQKQISKVTEFSVEDDYLEFGNITHLENTRAVIKVQDGCNNFCTYCIIPFARGRIRSRDKDNVLTEIKKIAEKGIKEIVLAGIHLDSYGKEKKDNYYLIDLIEDIDKIVGIERIRLGSLEPNVITEDFVNRIKKVTSICPHFHLSLQSGCDETLKRMNRKYTVSDIEKTVELLKSSFEDVNLTTDIIVGFPGETEKEFESTYNFLEKIKLFKMHIFKYSKRNGTVASNMPNQVSGNIAELRSEKLIELSNINEKDILKQYLKKEVEVLFETKDDDDIWTGHTKNYILVKYASKENLKNIKKNIKIISTESAYLRGTCEM